jgi:TRAP-type C4-dicarboxylate transport system permease small subunit
LSLVKVEKGIRYAGNILVVIGGVMFLVLMFLGASDVIGRYAFNKPIFGALEISEALMAGIVLLSWAYTQKTMGHVRVELFISRYSPRARAIVNFVGLLLSLALFTAIARQSTILALTFWQEHRVFPTMGIPATPFHFFVPVGAFFICLEFIIQMIHLIPEMSRGK